MLKSKKIMAWIFLIVWATLIFFFSSQPSSDSSELSSSILDVINKILPFSLDLHTIRKLAHFTEFFILGLLTCNVANSYHKMNKISLISSILFCVLYAISDEFHQCFVPGRGPGIKDVFIDSLGSISAIIIIYITIHKKKKNV